MQFLIPPSHTSHSWLGRATGLGITVCLDALIILASSLPGPITALPLWVGSNLEGSCLLYAALLQSARAVHTMKTPTLRCVVPSRNRSTESLPPSTLPGTYGM